MAEASKAENGTPESAGALERIRAYTNINAMFLPPEISTREHLQHIEDLARAGLGLRPWARRNAPAGSSGDADVAEDSV